jgi:O-antigen/teichoic acid export membrane protein
VNASEHDPASADAQEPTSNAERLATSAPSLTRSVVGSAGLLTAATGATRMLSMVTAPILTSLLGPTPYGVVALAGTATALITTLAVMGIETSYARAFFAGDASRKHAVERFCWRFVAVTTAVMALLVAVGWVSGVSERLGVPRAVAPMVLVGLVTSNVNLMVTARMRLRGAWSRIAIASIVSGVLASGSAIAFALWWRTDGWVLVLSVSVGVAAGVAALGGMPLGMLTRSSGLTREQRWKMFQIGLPVALTAPMYWVLSSSDRWFIGMLQDEHSLGVYSFAYNVGNFGALLNAAVIQTWLPETSRYYEVDPENAPAAIGAVWARVYALMAVVWLAVTASGGDVIRLLAAPEFHEGAAYIPWMAASIFFYGLYHTANTGLMLKNDLRPAAIWWLLGAALSVLLNSVLVRKIGAQGAAITATMSFAIISVGVMWSSQRVIRLEIPVRRVALVSLLLLGAGIAMAPPWHSKPLLSLCLKFPVGAGAAALALWLIAPAWLARVLRQMLRHPPRDAAEG